MTKKLKDVSFANNIEKIQKTFSKAKISENELQKSSALLREKITRRLYGSIQSSRASSRDL